MGKESSSPEERSPERSHRPVRSYALRKGRLTKGQRRALDELLPRYRLPESPETLDWPAIFGRRAPVAMEIGVGAGEALMGLARRHPGWDWVGVDVYPPGIGRLLLALEAEPQPHVRVALTDAVALLAERVPHRSLDAVYIFFPDPWPKARHRKRRLIQQPFLDLLAECMRPEAGLFLATDWEEYAQWMMAALEAHSEFGNAHGPGALAPRCPDRPLTKFEGRGAEQGHEVFDLHYRRP